MKELTHARKFVNDLSRHVFYQYDDLKCLANKIYNYKQQDIANNNILEIDVPGFNKDNLEVTFDNQILHIYGKTDTREINKNYVIYDNISPNNISATTQDGVLTIKFDLEKKESIKKINIE